MRHSKSIHTYIIAAAILLIAQSMYAQGLFAKKAMEHEERNHFVDASEAYQGLFERGSREASLQAARNLYKGRRYEEALKLYEHADSLGIITDADEVFRFFECLKSVRRYGDADNLVKARIKNFQNRPEFGLHEDKVNYYNKLTSYKGVELTALGLNTKYSEISPTVYDGWLYFVSTRPAAGNWKVHRINMQPFYNLYAVPLDGDMKTAVTPVGDFGKPEGTIKLNDKSGKSLPDGINKRYHDGPIRVTGKGDLLFFTSNHTDQAIPKEKKGNVNLRIFWSEKTGTTWATPKEIPGNSFDYSNQHAYYDEGTSTLYFASNRTGGKGGYDIWKMKRNSDGSWTEAENLGDKVNTSKSEVFPSLTPDGQLLFASNGWAGLGGLDMFLSDETSKQPLNLMAGINSEKDDFGLYFTDRNSGYLSSNRAGSAGDDDIWQFKMEWDLKTVKKYNTPGGEVRIVAKDAATKQGLASQINASASEDGAKAAAVSGGADGTTLELTLGQVVTVSAEGYEPKTVTVTEEMLETGTYSPELKALPDYKKGEIMLGLKDPQTGTAVAGSFINNGPGQPTGSASTSGQVPQEGAKVRVQAGDQIEFTAPGYEPATVVVTEDMIRSGKLEPQLVKARPADSGITVMAADLVTGATLDGQVTIVKDGKEYTRTLTAAGGRIELSAGDKVVVMANGYAPKTVTAGKADVKKGSLKVGLKPSTAGGALMVALKDSQTGASLSGNYNKAAGGAGSDGAVGASGARVNVVAGDRIEFNVEGYEPVTVMVTEEMIRTGRLDPKLVKVRPTDTALMVTAADPVTGSGVQASVKVIKGGREFVRTINPSGSSVSLSAGDRLVIAARGYAPVELTVSAEDVSRGALKISLDSVRPSVAGGYSIRPIYFDFDRFGIRGDAQARLDSIVRVMNADAGLRLELVSSADCRGSESYNKELSEQRAQATLKYIRQRISNPERITGKGIGEITDPGCSCEPGDKSPCPAESLQRNRKTEFRIVKQ